MNLKSIANRIKSKFKKVDVVQQAEQNKINKAIAEETCYLLFQNNGISHSFISGNFTFMVEGKGNDITITLLSPIPQIELAEGLPTVVVLDYTNDPTPLHAGCCCSLGYYVLRITFNADKVIQEPNRCILKGLNTNFSVYINRPQRDIYAKPPQPVKVNPEIFNEETYFKKAYMVPRNHWNPITVVTLLENEKEYHVLHEVLDMRSYYCGIVPVFYRSFDNKEEATKCYNESIDQYGSGLKEEFKPR